MQPTPIHVPDEVLDDLRRRLRATRWPRDDGNDDGAYGVRGDDLWELVGYWADGYDWRAAERAINAYPQYRVDVDGVPVHFLRTGGAGKTPLILSHGWPWTFWHWSKVIDALAEDFDVIVPSLPGFGFSTPTSPDMNFWKIADVWHTLMTDVLSLDRYAAAGCDVGALVTGQLGHKYASELIGIHIGSALRLDFFTGERGWDVSGGRALPPEGPVRDGVVAYEKRFAVHLAAHVLEPSTLSYGLTDSPAGLLAWLLQRWTSWSDNHGDIGSVFTPDDLLTHATIYWAGGSIGSSIRTYANNNRYPWTPSHDRWPVVEAPTGITFVGYENPPGVTTTHARVQGFLASDRAAWYRHVNITAHDTGGHFIPWEVPDLWVDDLRRTLRDRV